MRLLGVAALCLSPSLVFSQGQPSNNRTIPVARTSVQHSPDASASATRLTKTAPLEKPTPSDNDATGKHKYATYEDYIEALVDWKVSQRVSAAGKDVLMLPESDSQRFQIVFNPNIRADTFLSTRRQAGYGGLLLSLTSMAHPIFGCTWSGLITTKMFLNGRPAIPRKRNSGPRAHTLPTIM